MFNQGFNARLSAVAAVILRNTGNKPPSNTPRINAPVRIDIKQYHRLVPETMAAKSAEDTMRIIVWTPNGSGSSLAKIARTPIIKDNNNAFE